MGVEGFYRVGVAGAGARDGLDGGMCGRVPTRPGKVGLAYFLTGRGDGLGEATLALIDDETVWYGSAAASELHDLDWLRRDLPTDGSVVIEPLTETHTILVVAGPRSRQVLQSAAPDVDWSMEAFPWLSVRRVVIAGAEAVAMSVSFSGERAWELHVPMADAVQVYDSLTRAGEEHGMVPFGLYATESMRIEKGYRHWKGDLINEFDPFESGLDRFTDLDKPDFPGRDVLIAKGNTPPRRRFVTLKVHTDRAPAHPGDSVLHDGQVVGSVTSAAWGYRVKENLAMAFVDPDHAENGTRLTLMLLGERIPAEVVPACRYDPENRRVRG